MRFRRFGSFEANCLTHEVVPEEAVRSNAYGQVEGIVQKWLVVVLDNGQHLPEGTRVEVKVREEAGKELTLRERLLGLAGTVHDLPPDMARNHDHYIIHGAPKR